MNPHLDQASDRRKRDAQATRKALLVAAQSEFQRAGYEGASTRTIATEAGCNVALISRYFGSKKGLFEAVMGACFDLSPLKTLPRDEMISALVDIALEKAQMKSEFDPMVVAIRSSGSDESLDIISNQLGNPMVEELASILGGEDARQKAGVVLSIISGVFVGRVAIGAEALSSNADEKIRPLISSALKAVVSSGEGN